jgi:hypothetical protein
MGNVTRSQQNNITSPNGNSLAVFVEGTTGVMKVKDVMGNIQPLSDYISIPTLYSATFFDTTLQTNGGATTANQVLINSTQINNGFTLNGNSSVTILNTATYFFTCSLQLAFTGGASNYNVTVWFTINDVIEPNSAFTFTTTGAQNDQTLAVITDTKLINAGQNIKFYWWSQATGMRLLPTSAGSNPTRPLSPSVNLSIFNVA